MARKDSRPEVNRRKFLAGAAVAGAAVSTTVANAASPPAGAARIPSAVRPTAHQVALEANVVTEVKPMAGRAGSDFMVDVIKSLDIDYCYANPASSYRGIHESLINYGKNTKPEFITCMHEEVIGCDGARLLQGLGQAADDALPRHRRPDARDHGDL